MRLSTSISSWISNVLSKLNRYSNLRGKGTVRIMGLLRDGQDCGWGQAAVPPPPSHTPPQNSLTEELKDKPSHNSANCCLALGMHWAWTPHRLHAHVFLLLSYKAHQRPHVLSLGSLKADSNASPSFFPRRLHWEDPLRTNLSLEMLQSMTVFLLVLTMMKGKWMTELGGGGLRACCSAWRFLCTRFLKAIC